MVSLEKRAVGTMFNHGVLGVLVFVGIVGVGYLGHIFVPIFVERFKEDAKTQALHTVAMQQMAGAMAALHDEISGKHAEMIASAVNAACKRR
jgi:hypothetical protein